MRVQRKHCLIEGNFIMKNEDEIKNIMHEVWQVENKLPEHLKDVILLPNAELRRKGLLRELIAWNVRGTRMVSEKLGNPHAFPKDMTEEQFVDYLLEYEADMVLQSLRDSYNYVVRENRKRMRK